MTVKNICTNMVCTAYGQGTHSAHAALVRRPYNIRTPYVQHTYAVHAWHIRRTRKTIAP